MEMVNALLNVLSVLSFLAVLIVLFRIFALKPQDFTQQFALIERGSERVERSLKEEIARNREESATSAKAGREELNGSLGTFRQSILNELTGITTLQRGQLETFASQLGKLTESSERNFEKMRGTLEQKIRDLQEDNGKRLEQMRETVDEKLHATLERRLGESFKLVEEKLESVQKGLGEMQSLAAGVGDLKKVLTNVKSRGTWGEIQLGALLEQVLAPEQYGTNVKVKPGSREQVEYAIRLPGPEEKNSSVVWLPIDAKFPKEDYERLIAAQDAGDPVAVETAGKSFEVQVKNCAKTVRDKYIEPPYTTDFAIIYLPTEGLYSEVLSRHGLVDLMQRDYRVMVAGPTTLYALLNSLQMGFRTLAIQKRAGEVWMVLSTVKKDFSTLGDLLEKAKKKTDEVGNTIDTAVKRTRTIERKLDNVQELPEQPHVVVEIGDGE